MKTKLWQLKICDNFSSAHALRHYQGKCENMHGHNYKVELCLSGQKLSQDTELLLDFTILKKRLKVVLELLDHKILNETAPFDKINPSSERLAEYIFQEFAKLITEEVQLQSVTVEEKAGQSATYSEF